MESTRYQIIITEDDVPQQEPREGPGNNRRFLEEMVMVDMYLPKRFIVAIDRATKIGVGRPAVMRAIVRQAMEDKPEVVTSYARLPLYDTSGGE